MTVYFCVISCVCMCVSVYLCTSVGVCLCCISECVCVCVSLYCIRYACVQYLHVCTGMFTMYFCNFKLLIW